MEIPRRIIGSSITLMLALSVRAGPGLINLLSLTLLAKETGSATYGVFSTLLATAGVIANTGFGIGNLSIVAQYAGHAGRVRERVYIWTLFALWGGLAMLAVLIGIVASLWTAFALPTLALVLMSSLRGLLQELTRARGNILTYGVSDLLQALVFLGSVGLFVNGTTGPLDISLLFALSGLWALIVNVADLRGLLRPTRPSLMIARRTLGMGGWLSIGNLSENLLYTGARYLIGAVAGVQVLGVFSFSLDLAQRTVAFMVNAASFIYTPRAFSIRIKQGHDAFQKHLREGAAVALIAALCSMILIAIVFTASPLSRFAPEAFDLGTFIMVSLASTVNRLKKLIVDPVAMAMKRVPILVQGYIVGAAVALPLVYLGSRLHSSLYVAMAFASGYVVMFAYSGALLIRSENR